MRLRHFKKLFLDNSSETISDLSLSRVSRCVSSGNWYFGLRSRVSLEDDLGPQGHASRALKERLTYLHNQSLYFLHQLSCNL
jgi:hypothetical protein